MTILENVERRTENMNKTLCACVAGVRGGRGVHKPICFRGTSEITPLKLSLSNSSKLYIHIYVCCVYSWAS